KTPDNIAVVGPRLAESGSPTRSFSYKQLNEEANRLAWKLRASSVKPDSIVGIITEPSLEMYTAMFGIMKAGGGYLPIDPAHPEERIDFILEDSETRILLYSKKLAEKTRFAGRKICLEDRDITTEGECPNPGKTSDPEHLVYVIYTSGTTGKPKGVMTEHRNVSAYLDAFYAEFEIKATDTVLQQASYTFDVFVEEVYPILMRGGRVAVPGKDIVLDIELLADYVSRYKVNIVDCTPLLLNEINKAVFQDPTPWKTIHTFISGGDVLKPGYVDHLMKLGKVYNTYGPTESTVCITYYRYTDEDMAMGIPAIPIGKPIAHYQGYILDKNKKLQPIGVAGELCAAGRGVSRGYLNRPVLTDDKFIANPYMEGERLYRTGDLTRWLPDGTIDFMGRIDHQVKIRGYRIELGEIETRLAQHEEIEEAVILAIELPTGTALCAYYISRREIPIADIRDYMLEHLPPYMIPSYFVQLEKFPETSTGKVDRKALPDPVAGGIGDSYEAPRNSMEVLLASIWQKVLGIDQVGIDDDFFDLGGDSIKSMNIVAGLRKEQLTIDLKNLFLHSSIRKLAKHIGTSAGAETVEREERATVEQKYKGIPSHVKEKIEEEVRNRLGEGYEMQDICTLTPHQQDVLASTMANKESYYVHNLINISTRTDVKMLETAFNEIIRQYAVCRTIYTVPDNYEPIQIILQERKLTIDVQDISHLPTDKKKETLREIRAVDKKRGFDLTRDAPMRVILVKTGEDYDKLIWVTHNIIFDTYACLIMVEELIKAYDALIEDKPVELEPEIPFSKFVRWLEQEDKKEGWKQWGEYLEGSSQTTTLSKMGNTVEDNTYDLQEYFFSIDENMTDGLKRLAAKSRVTLNVLFQSMWGVLLQKYTGNKDVLIGSIVAGRSANLKGIERIVGLFLNTIPIRINSGGNPVFTKLLKEAQIQSLQLKEYEHLPVYEHPESPLKNKKAIDHLMFFQNIDFGEDADGEQNVFKSQKENGLWLKFLGNIEQLGHDFSWYVVPQKPILIRFGYNSLVYDEAFIQQTEQNLKKIARQVIDNPDIDVEDIRIDTVPGQ
ncbi:MAG: amino acid adenylation domain-containing protein, partial [bacterium]|nr:amino acid adenylation domain-containing protein [bacterium]